MPPFSPLAAMPLTIALASLPTGAAQAQQAQLKSDALRRAPVPSPQVHPAPRPQAEILLRDLPDDMLNIAQDADWPDPRRNQGILGVYRRGLPMRLCRQPSDSIDLRRIRAHGFRVVGYKLNDGLGPEGYKIAGYSNVRIYRYPSPSSDRLVNANTPSEIDRISVTPQVWVLDQSVRGKTQRMGCASTWGLEIRVVGPKGVNPYTGKSQ